jgi:hypothetical protein
MPLTTGVMPAERGVMPLTLGMMPLTLGMMPAATGMMSAVVVAASEESADLPLSAGAMPIPSGASLNPSRVFHVTAGEAPGSGQVAPIPAVVSPQLGGMSPPRPAVASGLKPGARKMAVPEGRRHALRLPSRRDGLLVAPGFNPGWAILKMPARRRRSQGATTSHNSSAGRSGRPSLRQAGRPLQGWRGGARRGA